MTDIENQLVILRMSLQAAQCAIDALSVLLMKDNPTLSIGECKHVNKKDVGTMTDPLAFYCLDCKATVRQDSTINKED